MPCLLLKLAADRAATMHTLQRISENALRSRRGSQALRQCLPFRMTVVLENKNKDRMETCALLNNAPSNQSVQRHSNARCCNAHNCLSQVRHSACACVLDNRTGKREAVADSQRTNVSEHPPGKVARNYVAGYCCVGHVGSISFYLVCMPVVGRIAAIRPRTRCIDPADAERAYAPMCGQPVKSCVRNWQQRQLKRLRFLRSMSTPLHSAAALAT